MVANKATNPKLSDLVKNDNKIADNKSENVNPPQEVKDTNVSEKNTNTSQNTDVEHGGSVVVPDDNTKHVDNTVGEAPEDGLVNPNGVAFGGSRANPINKTPADLAAETPQQTAKRFGISEDVPDDVHNNPNVEISRDNRIQQVASGTHLHPDVARDTYNSSLSRPSEAGHVTMSRTQAVYAQEAEIDDKGRKGFVENDPDADLVQGEPIYAEESKHDDKGFKNKDDK